MPVCYMCKIVEMPKSGLRCKHCFAAYMRKRRADDPEKYAKISREASAKRRAEKPETVRAADRDWYAKNADKVKARVKAYASKNKDAVKVAKAAYYDRNRNAIIAKNKEWQAANSERYKESVRRGVLNRVARKRNAEGAYSVADIRAIGERQRWECANPFCACDVSDSYHVDHMQPLSRGGSNWPGNLQLLCPSCNRRKGAKTMDEFLGTRHD